MHTNTMETFVNVAPYVVLLAAVIGLAFAVYKFFWVKGKPEGSPQMGAAHSGVLGMLS